MLVQQARTCLRLDEDFRPFHREVRRYPAHRWMATSGAGRLLRSPTVFEDAVKMICTTNCTWALTTLMTTNLVQAAGTPSPDGGSTFPAAGAIAQLGERFLRQEVKAGYRAPYIIALAEAVATGKLDVESWRHSPLSTDQLFREMQKVKGIGVYAAGNLLKLVGRYDYLGLDSRVRTRYYALHRRGRKVKDSTLEHDYEQFGQWRGLVFWLEMTKEWQPDKFPL
jgi:3-methyladenine DNA glycosylase/8-oxoguanine DNA glycosylase